MISLKSSTELSINSARIGVMRVAGATLGNAPKSGRRVTVKLTHGTDATTADNSATYLIRS